MLTPEAARGRAGGGGRAEGGRRGASARRRRSWSCAARARPRDPPRPRAMTGRAPAPHRTPRCGPSCARRGPRSPLPRLPDLHRLPSHRPPRPGGLGRHRRGAGGRARGREAGDPGRQRDREVPLQWGGGHGAWRDNGYDCSGSVSFALAGAGLLDRPLTSGDFMRLRPRGPRRLDHDLHQPGPRVHGGGGPALRHRAAAAGGRAPAGSRPAAAPQGSWCGTCPGCRQLSSHLQLRGPAAPAPAAARRPPAAGASPGCADQLGDHQALEVLHPRPRGPVDLEDQVLGPDAGPLGRAALHHLHDLDAARRACHGGPRPAAAAGAGRPRCPGRRGARGPPASARRSRAGDVVDRHRQSEADPATAVLTPTTRPGCRQGRRRSCRG